MVYTWVVFAHVAFVFGYLLSHGATIAVALKLRGEREPARIRPLLELSRAAVRVSLGFLGALVATGVLAGFMGAWWGQAWIWIALVLLVALGVGAEALGGTMRRLRQVVGDGNGAGVATDETKLVRLARSRRPAVVIVAGVVGLTAILWLMIFKP